MGGGMFIMPPPFLSRRAGGAVRVSPRVGAALCGGRPRGRSGPSGQNRAVEPVGRPSSRGARPVDADDAALLQVPRPRGVRGASGGEGAGLAGFAPSARGARGQFRPASGCLPCRADRADAALPVRANGAFRRGADTNCREASHSACAAVAVPWRGLSAQ